ncbi:hypothetical protein HYQ44_020008 [Verticillium longisporum]|nr:hypothetical protein HYQ44_020008 [Verticillium longisporum]
MTSAPYALPDALMTLRRTIYDDNDLLTSTKASRTILPRKRECGYSFPVPDFEHMTKEGAQKRTMFKAWCLGEDAKIATPKGSL